MAVNNKAVFVGVPNRGRVRLTTANTTRDLSVTTNAALLLSADTDGTRIKSITFTHSAASPTQASIAAVGRVWICGTALGATPFLFKEIDMPAVTPAAGAKGASYTISLDEFEGFFKAGDHIWVGISATQTSGGYDVVANAADTKV